MKSFKKFGIFAKRINASPHLDLYLFATSLILIILIKFYQFPSLTYHAEMFAEGATNYFINALNFGIAKNLVTTDAGYLPLAQRLIALLLVKGFHSISSFPFLAQLTAISFIAIMSSIVNLKIFKFINSSVLIRFILGLSIALISDYELNTFINFIYYGAILLFLVIFINKERLNNAWLIVISILNFLFLLSKGQFIIFVPIYLVMAVLHIGKKEYKSLLYYSCGILAGSIQLLVMISSFPKSSSDSSLLFMPYYFIKAIYYLILTYRHVFFGFVSKDGFGLLSILLLVILIILGIKKLFENKDKTTLYLFAVGNFIAFCSLFLTVVVLNNNVNPYFKNIVNSAAAPKSVSKFSNHITRETQSYRVSEKNIFDDKHLANLRSLFFSNLLIFLTGILVIMSIFPKKSQKIAILLIFCFSSGAFGQIKTEEPYPQRSMSYSQWEIYSSLLKNNEYCIPVNHYRFLLNQNCDYLFAKKSYDYVSEDKFMKNIYLLNLSKNSNNWNVQSVILIDQASSTSSDSFTLYAFDKSDKLVAKGKQLTPINYKYTYFLFDKPITLEKLILKNDSNKDILITPNIIVFGTNKTASQK